MLGVLMRFVHALRFSFFLVFLALSGMAEAQEILATPEKEIFNAIENNNLPEIQSLVTDERFLDIRNSWGMTPVDFAIEKENFDIAHYLLSLRGQDQQEEETQDQGNVDQDVTNEPLGILPGDFLFFPTREGDIYSTQKERPPLLDNPFDPTAIPHDARLGEGDAPDENEQK